MAGSWGHSVTDDGKLRDAQALAGMLDTGGDVWEYAEEAYGMVWWLATQLSAAHGGEPSGWVARAQESYVDGIANSPGVASS